MNGNCSIQVEALAGCYERCASTTGLIRRVRLVDETLDTGRKIFANKNREDVREQIDLWIGDICRHYYKKCNCEYGTVTRHQMKGLVWEIMGEPVNQKSHAGSVTVL